jgi:hypothetical protein
MGRLPTIRIGRRVRISLRAIEAIEAEFRVKKLIGINSKPEAQTAAAAPESNRNTENAPTTKGGHAA